MKTHSKYGGFTLVELLVVIAIIVLLTGIIVANLSGSRGKARDAQRVSDLAQLQLALALFGDRCGEYPAQPGGGILSSSMTSSRCPSGVTLGTYIQVPRPPAGAAGPYNADYLYTVYKPTGATASRINYILYAKLESPNAAVPKGMNAASIYDQSSSLGTWGMVADSPPWTACSNAGTSVDYCVGPN